MRTIKVTGKGKISVKPDLTRITIGMEGKYKKYDEALNNSSKDTERLKEILVKLGFEKTDLKTLDFEINPEYENYREKDVYKRRMTGYKYEHAMKLEFDSDNQRLGKILYALSKCSLHPVLHLSYTVKDMESAKNELLGKAVTDAKIKAKVLSEAAGIELKEIQSIDYSWGELNMEVRPVNSDCYDEEDEGFDECDSYNIDIEPDDIKATDTVTVTWEIS